MEQKTLYVTGARVIPLYESGSRESLVEAFGIGIKIHLDHVLGILPVSKHMLRKVCENATSLVFFRNSPGISSAPDPLLDFNLKTTL